MIYIIIVLRVAMSLNSPLVLESRKQIGGVRGRTLFFISSLVVLAGCSASSDSAGSPHQTIADVFGSSRSATAPAVVLPPPPNMSAEVAGQTVPHPPATYAPNASVSPTPPASTTYAANAPVAQTAPATYSANASVPPGASPDQPAAPPAENPFYSLYNSLKDGTEECSLPSEPCENNHRVQN
jgi:hypothetical protein